VKELYQAKSRANRAPENSSCADKQQLSQTPEQSTRTVTEALSSTAVAQTKQQLSQTSSKNSQAGNPTKRIPKFKEGTLEPIRVQLSITSSNTQSGSKSRKREPVSEVRTITESNFAPYDSYLKELRTHAGSQRYERQLQQVIKREDIASESNT
jgi:hypothetical protein